MTSKPFVKPRESPIGPIRHMIPFGNVCYPATLMQELGLRKQAFPLDWCVTSPRMVLHILEDDFATFLDPLQYYQDRDAIDNPGPDRVCHHRFYHERFGVPYVFSHHNVTKPEIRELFVRRVDRFRRMMASDETKLLFMLASWQCATEAEFTRLCGQIDARSAKAMLVLVNVEPRADEDATSAGARLVSAIGPHRLIRFESTSPSLGGLGFGSLIDDMMLRAMIGQYALATDR